MILINSPIAWFLLSANQDDLEAELACLEFDLENEEIFESTETPTAAVGMYLLFELITICIVTLLHLIPCKFISVVFYVEKLLYLIPCTFISVVFYIVKLLYLIPCTFISVVFYIVKLLRLIPCKFISVVFLTGTELPISPTTTAYSLPSAPNNIATLSTGDQIKDTSKY